MTLEHKDRTRNVDGTITDIYLDRKNHKITVKESYDLGPQVETNKKEYDVDNRGYHRDMEKMASIDARALYKAANERGTTFQQFVRDPKEMKRFLRENPAWKTRPGKL